MERPVKVTVEMAAKLMRKSPRYVRECMKRDILPIGIATQLPDSEAWNFFVSPTMLADFIGMSLEEVKEAARCLSKT